MRRWSDQTVNVEHEKSFKSNFELKLEKDRMLIEKRKALEEEGKDLSELDEQIGISSIQLAEEWQKQSEEFKERFNRDNDPKLEADQHSLKRRYDRKLVLLVRQKFNAQDDYTSPWILPQMKNAGEALKETAEKCLNTIAEDIKVATIHGSAPFASYKHKYPGKLKKRTGTDGNAIFFYSAHLHRDVRAVNLSGSFVSDYKWCTSEEVEQMLGNSYDRKYMNNFKHILVE